MATILQYARLALDYSRRWAILLNRARGTGTSLLDCAPVSIPGSQFSQSQASGVSGVINTPAKMNIKERQLQLVLRLQEG